MTLSYSPYASDIDLAPEMHSNPNYNLPDQAGYNACQSYAAALGLEIKHNRAGLPILVNRLQTYRGAMFWGLSGVGGNNGASVGNVARTWSSEGVPTNTSFYDIYQAPTPAEVANAAQYMSAVIDGVPYIRSGAAINDTIETLHMQFDRGETAIATFRLTASFDSDVRYQSNWRASQWDGSYATGGPSRGEHVVTLLGIDMVAGRVLAANHWGEDWGDGGFFGIPFDKFLVGSQGCVTQLHWIKQCAVPAVPFRTAPNAVPMGLTSIQQHAFDNAMKAELAQAYGNTANWPAALFRAVELKLTPAQFEDFAPVLGGLPRGTVRSYIDQSIIQDPGFDWVKTYDQAIRYELALAAGGADPVNAAVNRAIALKLSDKLFEMHAPLGGGIGAPRGIVREFVDRGDLPDPGFRWEAGA